MVIRYTCKRICILMLAVQVQRIYMGYLVKYWFQKFLVYSYASTWNKKGIKGYKHAQVCAIKIKYSI